MRIAALTLATALLLSFVPGDPVCVRLPSTDAWHPSGLAIAPGWDPCYFRSEYEPVKKAFDLAYRLAEANPDDLGYPWDDRANHEIVLSVVTPRGMTIAQQWTAAGWGTPESGVTVRIRTVTRSFRELERIKHDAIEIARARIPGSEYIGMTTGDHEHDRVLIGMVRLTDEVANEIKRRYGTDAVAVLLGSQYGPWGLPLRN